MARPYLAPTLGTVVTVTSGNLTLTEPSGSASGDLLVACIAARGNAAFTLPAGWAICGTQQLSGNTTVNTTGSIASGLMAYIVRGGSAPSYAFTRTSGDLGFGRVMRCPGPFAASPLDQASANTIGAASATVTATGFTTGYDSALLVGMVASARAGSVSGFVAATSPAMASGAADTTSLPDDVAWIERADTNTTSGADGGLGIFDAVKTTAGATGNFSATHSLSARHVMIVAAFKNAGVDLTEERVSRLTGYAVIDSLVKNLEISRLTGYAVLAPVPFVPPPKGGGNSGGSGKPGKGPKGRDVSGAAVGTVGATHFGRYFRTHRRFVLPSLVEAAGVSVEAPVSGQEVSVAVGPVTVTTTGAVEAPVIGQEVSVEVGSVAVSAESNVAVPVGGQEVAVAVGEVSVTGAADVSVSGQEVTVEVGHVTVVTEGDVLALVGGQSVSVQVGGVTATGETGGEVLPSPPSRRGMGGVMVPWPPKPGARTIVSVKGQSLSVRVNSVTVVIKEFNDEEMDNDLLFLTASVA